MLEVRRRFWVGSGRPSLCYAIFADDDDDDDDVYYYIRWRLKLEGETENTGVCTLMMTITR